MSEITNKESASRAIPITKATIDSSTNLSQTPGGTLFSTTPGGTVIIYDKNTLLNLRNSPISRTPPNYLIPDRLIKGTKKQPSKKQNNNNNNKNSNTNTNTHHHNNNIHQRGPKIPTKIQRESCGDEQFHIDL